MDTKVMAIPKTNTVKVIPDWKTKVVKARKMGDEPPLLDHAIWKAWPPGIDRDKFDKAITPPEEKSGR